jgi:hypothetical protein
VEVCRRHTRIRPTEGGSISKFGESNKQKRARLRKIATFGTDPRQRLWALTQLDEMAAGRADRLDFKAAAATPAKAVDRDTIAHLERQAVHHPDSAARLRAQDRLRELARD